MMLFFHYLKTKVDEVDTSDDEYKTARVRGCNNKLIELTQQLQIEF